MRARKGLALVLALVLLLLTGCAADGGSGKTQSVKAEDSLFAMDTYMSFTVYGEDAQSARKALDDVKRLISER